MKIKHLIFSRLALNYKDERVKVSREEWIKNSVWLYDTFCRPSLKNQTNQNFTLVTLVDESVSDVGNVLDNEIVIRYPNSGEKINLEQKLFDYTSSIDSKEYDYIISTRLDRDDGYDKNFVDNMQKYLIETKPKTDIYIDIYHLFSYDSLSKKMYKSSKYLHSVSPFVSLVHIKPKFKSVYSFQHVEIPKHYRGTKLNNIFPVQVIHETNLLNKITGIEVPFNYNDFWVKEE